MKNNNIAFFNVNRIDFDGGAEKYIKILSENLQKLNYKTYYYGNFKFILLIYILTENILFNFNSRGLLCELKKLKKSFNTEKNFKTFYDYYDLTLKNIIFKKKIQKKWMYGL